jgi:hypothetical protein
LLPAERCIRRCQPFFLELSKTNGPIAGAMRLKRQWKVSGKAMQVAVPYIGTAWEISRVKESEGHGAGFFGLFVAITESTSRTKTVEKLCAIRITFKLLIIRGL